MFNFIAETVDADLKDIIDEAQRAKECESGEEAAKVLADVLSGLHLLIGKYKDMQTELDRGGETW